eukprot:1064084-Amorphochlora_amoeboformis.AAC.1
MASWKDATIHHMRPNHTASSVKLQMLQWKNATIDDTQRYDPMPCHAMPSHAILCHPMPSHGMPCYGMP